MKHITITNFTDPVCIWCWGTEPIFRALETHYPDLVEFRYVMGGLVDDINNFADPGNGIDAGAEGANEQIVEHWIEAVEVHGMPVKPEGFHLFSNEFPSTYPQNIAYKAAQIVDPGKADAYLRRIREATLTEAKVTGDVDVLIELACEVGLERAVFSKALKSKKAEQAFHADLRLNHEAGVEVFPSFLVEADGEGEPVLLRGFITYEEFKDVIRSLTQGTLLPTAASPSMEAIHALLAKHQKLAFEEVYKAFDFTSREQAHHFLEDLIGKQILIKEEVGLSYFVRMGL
jgi:predicted DsbA family dithiol-disulfide isomerase